MKLLLRGDKRSAVRLLPYAKALLARLKKSSLTGAVNKWQGTTGGDLINVKSFPGLVDTIFIKSQLKARKYASFCGTFAAFTLDACMAVDIWDQLLSGWVTVDEGSVAPGNVANNFEVGHGDCDSGWDIIFESLFPGSATSATLTSIDLYMAVLDLGVGETFTVQPFVWNEAGGIVASGLSVVVNSTDSQPVSLPITFNFTVGDFYYFGVKYLSGTVKPRWLDPGLDHPYIQAFDSGLLTWGQWDPASPHPAARITSHIGLTFSDSSYNVDQTKWTNRSGSGGAFTMAPEDFNRPLALKLTAYSKHLLTMHPQRGTLFRQSNVLLNIDIQRPVDSLSFSWAKIYIFKWTLGNTYVSSVSLQLPVVARPKAVDIEFLFSTGRVDYTQYTFLNNNNNSPVIVDGTGNISTTFLVDGFKYTVGVLKNTPNELDGDGNFTYNNINVFTFPRNQRGIAEPGEILFGTQNGDKGFDSWFGQKINTNSRESDGLVFPAFTIDANPAP